MRECPSQKAALRELEDRVREANAANNDPTRPRVTFRELVEGLWNDYLDNKGIKPSTRYSYDSILKNHLLPEFENLQVDEITPAHLTRFFQGLCNRGLSSKYRTNLYGLLKILFEVAAEYDLIDASRYAARSIGRPTGRPRK